MGQGRPASPVDSARLRRGTGEEGFTLLELLVVLGIIALITAVAAPRVSQYLSNAKAQTAATQLSSLESALELYLLDVGSYPPDDAGLEALLTEPPDAPGWNGPYLRKKTGLLDPWERPYVYRMPGDNGPYDLYSLGRDGAEGGEGEDADVTNW